MGEIGLFVTSIDKPDKIRTIVGNASYWQVYFDTNALI